MHGATAAAEHQREPLPKQPVADWDIEVYFDGECPLCRREIEMLRRRDRHQRIRFTDIAAPDFDAAATGKTLHQLMAEIHGRLPDGTIISGVEVFRRLYTAIGCRTLAAAMRLPGISRLLDWGYQVFARSRLKLTGRQCAGDTCRRR
ncbi:MAG: DUF393 domain-containing protein [Planctomycetaceae bacterium]|nr:DUF393 domain-containing protein [Planctomycetaceae bacterium]